MPLEIRNVAPSATLTSTLACLYSGDTIPLAATVSDPGGADDPLTIEWDFSYDGTTFNPDANAGSSVTQSHTFNTASQTIVAVRATDQSGATTIATRTLTVTALPSVSIEADDDAPIINQPTSYYVTFNGDSQGFNGVAWDLSYNSNTFNPDSSAVDWYLDANFAAAGSRTIATQVTDLAGQQILATLAVTVHYPPPVLTVGNDLIVNVGEQVTLQASVADPSAITQVQWFFSYDGMDYELDPNLTLLSQTDSFNHYGEYDVGVRVTDNHGEQAEAGFHVSVIAPTPTADMVTVNGPIAQGSDAVFTVHVNDPDVLDVVTVFARWNTSGEFDEIDSSLCTNNSDGSFSFKHAYNYPGTFTPTIRLDEDNGLTTDYSVSPLVVTPVALAGALTTDSPFKWNATAGETWLMGKDNTVRFTGVSAPNTRRLEYHFEFTNTTDSSVPAKEVVTNNPYASVPSYAPGTAYDVRAWIVNLLASQDDGNPASVPNFKTNDQTTHLICGSYAIPLWGDLSLADPASLDNGKVGAVKIASNTETTITFKVDPKYREIWPSDVPANIYLHVSEQDTGATWLGLGDPSYAVVSTLDILPNSRANFQTTGELTFTLPGYVDNRQINVNVVILPFQGGLSGRFGTRPSLADNQNSFPASGPGPSVNMVTGGTGGAGTSGGTGGAGAGGTGGGTQPGQMDPGTGGAGGGPTYTLDVVSPGIGSLKLVTNHELSAVEKVSQALKLAEDLANQFGANATALFNAVRDNPGLLIENLFNGLKTGLTNAFEELTDPAKVIGKVLSWLIGGPATPPATLQAVIDAAQTLASGPGSGPQFDQNLNALFDKVKTFFLEYSGLTWDNLRGIIQQQLGAGNYAAAEKLMQVLGNVDSGTPDAIVAFLRDLPNKLDELAADLGEQASVFQDLKNDFSWTTIGNLIKDRAADELKNALLAMAPRLLAKFDPTAGALVSLYDGFTFLISNGPQFAQVFEAISNSMGALADSVNNNNPALVANFATGVKNAVTGPGLNLLLDFAARQLGLGGLKDGVRNVLQFIPNTVNNLMRRLVSAITSKITQFLPGGSTGLYGGLVGRITPFTYQNQSYSLWAAKPRTGPIQIKVAQGTQLVGVLASGMFTTADSRAKLAEVIRLAGGVAGATTPRLASDAVGLLTTAEGQLAGFVTSCPCTLLNTGCFAAGTKLWTSIGYRAIEEIQPGEPIYSRNEFDPAGPVEVKMVEETFTRFAPILHLHVGGHVIRTTGEHPFFAYDKGWVKAASLQIGDRLLTAASEWTLVEDTLDTGDWEPVFNLRVAEHHTYFVGDWNWGFAVWAHNSYSITNVTGQTYASGSYKRVQIVNDSTQAVEYNQVWFVPTGTNEQAIRRAARTDQSTGIGIRLAAKAQELADGWRSVQLARDRYLTYFDVTERALQSVNGFLEAAGLARLTLDQVDQQGSRPGQISGNDPYNQALAAFWRQRASAIGAYVHARMKRYYEDNSVAGLTYQTSGPDFRYVVGGQTTYFEVLPDNANSRARHSERPVSRFLWRAVYYNRDAANGDSGQ